MRCTIHPVDGHSLPTDPTTYVELPSIGSALNYARRSGIPWWGYYGHGLNMHDKRDPYPDFVIENEGGKVRKVMA